MLLRDNWWGEPVVNEGVWEELYDCHIVTGDLPGSLAFNGLGYTTIVSAKRIICIENRII